MLYLFQKVNLIVMINYKPIYKQSFERTLIRLKNYVANVENDYFFNVKNVTDDSECKNGVVKAMVFIKTQRVRLSTLAYVVRVTCGQSELELITANNKVIFYGFLDKCDEVVNRLQMKLEQW